MIRSRLSVAIALAALAASCSVTAIALGSSTARFTWSAPLPLFSDFARVNCADTASPLCLVSSGRLLSISTAPAGSARSWRHPISIPSYNDVSCPTRRLCIGVDGAGGVVGSSNPTGGGHAWSASSPLVSTRIPHSPDHNYLTRVACPSTRLCVVSDFRGRILTSSAPAPRKRAWSAPVRITPVAEDDIEGLSCPSMNLCVAVTGHGWVLTTTRPTGGASAWHGFRSAADGLVGLACHSGSACVAYDGLGNIVSSNDPTGGRSAWTRPIMVDRTAELDGISCPTARRCVAVDGNGDAQTIDPSSSRPTWTAPHSIDRAPPSSHSSRALTTVACPSARLCVAADDVGNVIVGRAG